MNKNIVKVIVFIVSILTANLISDYTSNYLTSFKDQYKPLTFTLLAMGIIVIVFFPLFEFLDKLILKISKEAVRKGKSVGGKYLGLFIVFFVAMILLIFFYVKLWYGINIFKFILNPNYSKLF